MSYISTGSFMHCTSSVTSYTVEMDSAFLKQAFFFSKNGFMDSSVLLFLEYFLGHHLCPVKDMNRVHYHDNIGALLLLLRLVLLI